MVKTKDTETAVTTVNMDMLAKAEKDGAVGESVMKMIHTFKVYNPKIGEPADPDMAGKFKVFEANTGNPVEIEGEVKFNPLDVAYFYSGSIYPILENKEYAKDKVFFFTNEFSKYAKKSDVVGLAANNKGLGFFVKSDLEEMLRTPLLNGGENQFFERKKDKEGKPYNSSQLRKSAMIYGQFIDGEYKGELFRMPTGLNNIGITFRDGAVCDPLEGTFEYAINQGLDALNQLLESNGRKKVKRISPDQCDLSVTVRENERGNFLPVFKFIGLVAKRGIDNTGDQQFIYDLRNQHFQQVFGKDIDITPTSVMISSGNVIVKISQPRLAESTPTAKPEKTLAEEALEIFGDPVEEVKALRF